MIFGKKKGMIDIRELQKRGVVRIPSRDIIIPTNQEGFIELGADKRVITSGSSSNSQKSSPSTNTEFFGFMDTPSNPKSSMDSFSTQSNGYDKREVDEKIIELDNKIYKLEQRIELLERKLGVGQSSNSSSSVMGW